jgi:hypothetical protein
MAVICTMLFVSRLAAADTALLAAMSWQARFLTLIKLGSEPMNFLICVMLFANRLAAADTVQVVAMS